ncbi:MAG: MFS transporter, partial [Pseudomonadota bacterium]
WALILAALPGFVLAAAMMIVCRDPRPGKSPSTQIDAAIPQRGALADLLEQPGYRYLCVAATLSSMGGYMVLAFLPAYAIRTFDLSTGIVGSALALLLGVGGGLGTYLGGVLGDRTTQRGAASPLLISMAACVISGPMFLLAFYISNLPLLAFMLVVPCVTMTAWMGPNWATVQSLSAIKHRAFASAFILLLINLIGLGAGPTLVGLLSDVFTGLGNANGLRAALSVSMSVFPLAGLFFWLAHRSCARKSASDAAFAVSTE